MKAYLAKGLTFQTEFGMDYLSQNEEGYFQNQTVRNQTRATAGLGTNRGAFVTNYNTQSYFNYSTVVKKHNISATLGT